MNLRQHTTLSAAAAIGFLLLAAPAFADPMGTFNVANCSGGGWTIDATHITWLPVGTVAGTGCINTGAGTDITSSLGTLLPGATGNIKNLTSGGPSTVDQFMTFLSPAPGLDFVLTALEVLPSDDGTNCAATVIGKTCTWVAGSPFLLTNLGSLTELSLNVDGTVTDANGTSTWHGAFTTQFAATAADIQSTILGGGSITSTQSGTFKVSVGSTTVPEPGSMMLFGTGLAMIAEKIRRKLSRHTSRV